MSNICDNIYSTCNLVLINIAWFAEQIFTDLNTIRKDLESCYDEDNPQIESQGRQRLKNAGLLKPYKYVSTDYDEEEQYIGDEDWLEPWDKV